MQEYIPMRRKDRALPEQDTRQILERGEYGVLSTAGEDGLAYGTPLSYVLRQDVIYFHCAAMGHKIQNLRKNPKVCFTVVGATQPIYVNKDFSTLYESVVVFGEAFEVVDTAEKYEVLADLCRKYLPQHEKEIAAALATDGERTAVWA